ncbi:MAG TPA: DUF5667 domain-containing protein, partial [Ardenticatenaceae bacterium]|nr:DUF5667 domain-containing protein [Ardenticatenaceae bacterium]
EALIAYAAGELGPVEADSVAAHLAVCPECAATVARFRLVSEVLRTYDTHAPPPPTVARAKSLFRQHQPAPQRLSPWASFLRFFQVPLRYSAAGALAVLLLAVTLVFGGLGAVAASAQKAIPGDALYAAKTTIEGLQVAISLDQPSRAELYVDLAGTRLEEIAGLIARGRYQDLPATVAEFERQIVEAAESVTAVAAQNPERGRALALQMEHALSQYGAELRSLHAGGPPEAQEAVARALVVAETGEAVVAQRTNLGQLCYAVADNGESSGPLDKLVRVNTSVGALTLIGDPGTEDVEAVALDNSNQALYAANGAQLGTLDLITGAFIPLQSPFGTGRGAQGTVVFNNVDGLAFDPTTGFLYGVQRLGREGDKDVLFRIDPATGAAVLDAFAPGVDYVPIGGEGVLEDIDDIAFDPRTGLLYGASNDSNTPGGVLVVIDKLTGAATVVGSFGVDDIEGLSFAFAGGLYGSTGSYTSGPPTTNHLFAFDANAQNTSEVVAFNTQEDYEAVACLTAEASWPQSSLLQMTMAGERAVMAVPGQ